MKTLVSLWCMCGASLLLGATNDAANLLANLLGTSNAAPVLNVSTAVLSVVTEPATDRVIRIVEDVGTEPEVGVDTSAVKDHTTTELPAAAGTRKPTEISIYGTGAETSLALRVFTSRTGSFDRIDEEHRRTLAAVAKPGWLMGKITDHAGTPLRDVKIVLFNDKDFKSMPTTPGGNFGFSVTASNEYYLTATLGNQFFYTNVMLIPAEASVMLVRFLLPIAVYGQLFIDKQPAQQGLFLRMVGPKGELAGGVVVSNGLFQVKDLTPGRYTMVLERRKQFIDRRINESRFYYLPLSFTSDTMRISFERDRRLLSGFIKINGVPQTHVNALVILKDAQTDGKLIHREAYTYTEGGRFAFNHVQPGTYTLQAIQAERLWHTPVGTVEISPDDRSKSVSINVTTDEGTDTKRLDDLRHQFLPEEK